MDKVFGAILRTIFTFFFVLAAARFVGRKLISQMTFFDFVLGVALGSTAAGLALGPRSDFGVSATVILVLTALTVLTGYIHIKSRTFQKLVDSEPIVVIANGKIVEENMAKERFTINELNMLLREKNVFNPADVEFAVLETDGKLSVQVKSQKLPITPADLGLSTSYIGLTKDLIVDGAIMNENLREIHLDEAWLQRELAAQGIRSVEEVFYAGLDTAGHLFVSVSKANREKHGKYGIE